MTRYLIIIATGVAVGALTKVMATLGLLDMQASTAGYLVTVIAVGVEVGRDIRTYEMERFDRWLSHYLATARPSAAKAERAWRHREAANLVVPMNHPYDSEK